ncbi:hypothetical protein D8M04_07025 [Oceanobacillus piezotolerans]|uniref:Uncharacterized protein n=1 Tax=Oceanobacillus piezotolerans TaxID=2448030 RepID=A0A498DKC9_9BACI|nr:hypothetical protein [Oceanobacillus piezotolerans]RLL46942.1 hypothetical protein D8M04_07025 [Oceanobacillus piezotolerans]
MNVKEALVFIIGIFVTVIGFLFSGLFTVYVIDTNYGAGESNLGTDIALVIILGVIPLGIGILLCRYARKSAKKRMAGLLEDEILKLVTSLNGKITIAELAANTKLSIQESEQQLETFVKIGASERQISDGGVFVYYFRHIISQDEKEQAKPI